MDSWSSAPAKPGKFVPEDFGVRMSAFTGNIIGAFSRALSDRMEEAVEEATGMGKSACYAIVQVGTEPGSSIETLRHMLNLDHSSLVRSLSKLENIGLLNRVRGGQGDARVVRIYLTEDGERCFTKILDARREVVDKSVAMLSQDELGQLCSLVGKMSGGVVKAGDDQHFVCRLCDLEVCPQKICPVNCAHEDHYEEPEEPFRRKIDSKFSA